MSTVKANDLTNVTGGIPTVKSQQLIPTAWVNFNGSGTVAIRGSENVSSITDGGVGRYGVNLSITLANTNYAISITGTCANTASGHCQLDSLSWGGAGEVTGMTTTSFKIRGNSGAATVVDIDHENVNAIVMGGQA